MPPSLKDSTKDFTKNFTKDCAPQDKNPGPPIPFRPHHFLCANGFEGKGYSPAFVKGFREIVAKLRAPGGDGILLQVVEGADQICGPCPHRREKKCAKQALVASLDQRHQKALRLQTGEILTWGEAKARLQAHVTEAVFQEMCHGCGWQKEGICLRALKALRLSADENCGGERASNPKGEGVSGGRPGDSP